MYRQSVLSAFQQVEDDLANLRILEKQAALDIELVRSAHEAETLTLNQYRAGTVPYSSVIAAQTTTFSSEQTALSVLRSPVDRQRGTDLRAGRWRGRGSLSRRRGDSGNPRPGFAMPAHLPSSDADDRLFFPPACAGQTPSRVALS